VGEFCGTVVHLQFPAGLRFAIGINKSPGQSLKILDLKNPCFAHGLLDVGFPTAGDKNKWFVLAPNGKSPCVRGQCEHFRVSFY
jgi:hypothetical protein